MRVTHWITALSFFALVLSGVEILISHPRFYWGDEGHALTPSLFELPIPASRAAVKTGFGFVLPDQNGWSRALHFQSAWLVVLAGLCYFLWGWWSRHFRVNLLPASRDLAWPVLAGAIRDHLGRRVPDDGPYNVLQRLAYASVIFILFPMMIWTGLAMSPAIVSAFPGIVTILGGHQSARTIHFFVFLALMTFFATHVVMVVTTGFRKRMRGMVTGVR
ncbi:MAG: cytochrome b/b6 domain-containing protein [Bryobacterales bacterium]|nr:cytochrome b/b6 domain-containing protein [Bryobacterales bacterium]